MKHLNRFDIFLGFPTIQMYCHIGRRFTNWKTVIITYSDQNAQLWFMVDHNKLFGQLMRFETLHCCKIGASFHWMENFRPCNVAVRSAFYVVLSGIFLLQIPWIWEFLQSIGNEFLWLGKSMICSPSELMQYQQGPNGPM